MRKLKIILIALAVLVSSSVIARDFSTAVLKNIDSISYSLEVEDGFGSGVVVCYKGKTIMLTCAHVMQESDVTNSLAYYDHTIALRRSASGASVDAIAYTTLLWPVKEFDLALLEMEISKGTENTARLADKECAIGEDIIICNPIPSVGNFFSFGKVAAKGIIVDGKRLDGIEIGRAHV